MSKVLVINYGGSGDYLGCARIREKCQEKGCFGLFLSGKLPKKPADQATKGKRGSARIGLIGAGFLATAFIASTTAFYLFQVNDLATKGYEIRDLENRIQDLEKENKRLEIREVELTSMYSIEKSTESLGLVSSGEASYVEMGGTVAMK